MTNLFSKMHVSLYVSDLQKSILFYNRFFSQQPTKVKPGYAKYILDSPPLVISFIENKQNVQSNFGHLGFLVETPEDLEQKRIALKELIAKEETGVSCCYAKQDKFWLIDPDGIQWEVYFFHGDSAFNDPHYAWSPVKDSEPCCTVSADEVKSNCGCNANVESSVSATAACC